MSYIITGLQFELFTSYLIEIRETVEIGGVVSDAAFIKYGGSQDSVFGPVLLLVFICELTSNLSFTLFSFGHYTAILNSRNDFET